MCIIAKMPIMPEVADLKIENLLQYFFALFSINESNVCVSIEFSSVNLSVEIT